MITKEYTRNWNLFQVRPEEWQQRQLWFKQQPSPQEAATQGSDDGAAQGRQHTWTTQDVQPERSVRQTATQSADVRLRETAVEDRNPETRHYVHIVHERAAERNQQGARRSALSFAHFPDTEPKGVHSVLDNSDVILCARTVVTYLFVFHLISCNGFLNGSILYSQEL